jgi:hypothetical protein
MRGRKRDERTAFAGKFFMAGLHSSPSNEGGGQRRMMITSSNAMMIASPIVMGKVVIM